MKQLLQDLQTGDLVLEDVPTPQPAAGKVLIRTHRTLISAGTERMVNDFANANYLNKARQQPDRVREVLQKVRTDGLLTTVDAVQSKLGERIPLGYCNSGEVIAVGSGVTALAVGDRVVSNGPHSQLVVAPENLVAKIPDDVDHDTAVYTVISSIGLQGVRLIDPTLGERVVVFGLGLVGLLAVQILRANGCQVLGFDFVEERVKLARDFGAEAIDLSTGADPVAAAMEFSRNVGVDAVLVTASTSSDELMHQAAQMSRQRGRIVLTGVVGLDLKRSDFYEKELQFSVSCSYGPGRYDPAYEDRGHDYPLGYVRWTEQRNFEAVLDLMADQRLKVDNLTTARFDFADAAKAYASLSSPSEIGVVMSYDTSTDVASILAERSTAITPAKPAPDRPHGNPVFGVIGAGSFANGVLLPGLQAANARLKWIASSGGTSGSAAARRFGIEQSTTDTAAIFEDPEVTAIVVSTRHNTHAGFVCAALEAGKDVFVEKPLAIDRSGLDAIVESYERAASGPTSPRIMVGFNRRFAPTTQTMRHALRSRQGPIAATFVGNAGAIPADHWTQDPAIGGGRIVGEACHYIDYLAHLVGHPIVAVSATSTGAATADTATIQLSFADDSIGTVHYFANGAKALAKERAEIYFDGKILQMDNFKSVKSFGGAKQPRRSPALKQDKGHAAQFKAFADQLRTGGPSPIPLRELVNVTLASFAAVESIATGERIELAQETMTAPR